MTQDPDRRQSGQGLDLSGTARSPSQINTDEQVKLCVLTGTSLATRLLGSPALDKLRDARRSLVRKRAAPQDHEGDDDGSWRR